MRSLALLLLVALALTGCAPSSGAPDAGPASETRARPQFYEFYSPL